MTNNKLKIANNIKWNYRNIKKWLKILTKVKKVVRKTKSNSTKRKQQKKRILIYIIEKI